MSCPEVRVPWAAWYEEREETLQFPDGWHVEVAKPPARARPLSDDELRARLAQAIGTKPLRELARGKRKVALVSDDLTRPTPTDHLLPLVIEELRHAGITSDQIIVLIASGSHRFWTRADLLKKLGRRLCSSFAVYNHHVYENLSHLGQTSQGTDIYINKTYLECDLRISLGTIMPHASAGFAAGPKTVAIGLAGMETLLQNHDGEGVCRHAGPVGNVDNPMQEDLVEIARTAGLDLVINTVLDSRRRITGLFVGDAVEAHRQGVCFARDTWLTEVPRLVDVGVFNAYPKDTEAIQSFNALNPTWVAGDPVVREGGAVVITTASPEGTGIHSHEGYGMRGHVEYCRLLERAEVFRNRRVLVFSPNLTPVTGRHVFPDGAAVFSSWPDVVHALEQAYPGKPHVAVFPTAPFQLAV
jgi:nickel-dependent lactate racemase